MSFCGYMDPLNWSFRFYLLESIEKVGFENGWDEIIKAVNQLSTTLLNTSFEVNPKQCHLFYLQMLAEFGDFRSFSDPLTLPSQEVIDKIKQMRRAELRHDLIITNNQMRYNDLIISHHGGKPIKNEITWKRFNTSTEKTSSLPSELAHIASSIKSCDWYQELPPDGKGQVGLKDMSIDRIIYRCVNGTIITPLELARDIFHLIVNLTLNGMNDVQRNAVEQMRAYILEKLGPMLEKDPKWERVRVYFEGTDDEF